MMLKATKDFADYQMVVAGSPGILRDYYDSFMQGQNAKIVYNETYPLLYHSTAALVTSGTATLETAMFGVPQVVCYKTPLPKIIGWAKRHILKVKYISLVNLIADDKVVEELVADTFQFDMIRGSLYNILPSKPLRQPMLDGYKIVQERLGYHDAPLNAARLIYASALNN